MFGVIFCGGIISVCKTLWKFEYNTALHSRFLKIKVVGLLNSRPTTVNTSAMLLDCDETTPAEINLT